MGLVFKYTKYKYSSMSRYSKNNQTSFQKYTRLYCFQTSVMSIYFLKENIFKNLLKRYICRKKEFQTRTATQTERECYLTRTITNKIIRGAQTKPFTSQRNKLPWNWLSEENYHQRGLQKTIGKEECPRGERKTIVDKQECRYQTTRSGLPSTTGTKEGIHI